ncbi:plasmid partitioning protein RepB [Pseudovibrio ascidiaceicola]|uniref:plasmid partitioning protein RepB n=1 Tax=Pseudovibrio ascidiaceicola TaxID=285279 RepID=UPI003D35F786
MANVKNTPKDALETSAGKHLMDGIEFPDVLKKMKDPTSKDNKPGHPVPSVNAVQQTLGGVAQERDAAYEALEEAKATIETQSDQLERFKRERESGDTVQSMPTDLFVASFLHDRISIFDDESDDLEENDSFASLIKNIEANGQETPILARPHPEIEGRYQIAYGHRRHAACEELGREVKARIKNLTDDEMIKAQNSENQVRAGLSFLEEGLLFLNLLKEKEYNHAKIARVTGSSQTKVAKALSIIQKLPNEEILREIGKAKDIGRPRWNKLSKLCEQNEAVKEALAKLVETDTFKSVPTGKPRFEVFMTTAMEAAALTPADVKAKPGDTVFGNNEMTLRKTRKSVVFEISKEEHPALASYFETHGDDVLEFVREKMSMN